MVRVGSAESKTLGGDDSLEMEVVRVGSGELIYI